MNHFAGMLEASLLPNTVAKVNWKHFVSVLEAEWF